MVALYIRNAWCILVALSLSMPCFASETFFNANTVPTTSGSTARLVGITSINTANRTASVVIDARDRFGNPIRRFKTGSFSPSKLKNYAKTCLRNPLACVAVSAISSALVYYGYTVTTDGEIFVSGSGASYPSCVDKPLENSGGSVVTAHGPIPCANGPNWNGKWFVSTIQPLQEGTFISESEGWYYHEGDSLASHGTLYQYSFSTEPMQSPQEITDEALADILLESPEFLQFEPGFYGDIFEPMDISDTAAEGDFSETPDPEPESDPDPAEEYEEMISMEAVPEEVIDISEYFQWGSGWLPRSCPSPQSLATVHGQTFTFDYTHLCSMISQYVAPFMRFIAIIAFLGIVIGGVRV